MKKKRFSVEHIVRVLKQAEMGVPVVELIRKAESANRRYIGERRSTLVLRWIKVRPDEAALGREPAAEAVGARYSHPDDEQLDRAIALMD
jgi:putative transposase